LIEQEQFFLSFIGPTSGPTLRLCAQEASKRRRRLHIRAEE